MNAITSNLLSGLIGSLIGGVIAGFAAIESVKRAEYYRHCAMLKRMLRDIHHALEAPTGHPAVKLNDKLSELTQLVDDVMMFATRYRRLRILYAWHALAVDDQAKELNMEATPTEYTTKGTIEGGMLIKSRIAALIAAL